MIPEQFCNSVVVTDLLVNDHPDIYKELQKVCEKEQQSLEIVSGVNDYWCRDFLPVQVHEDQFVQFQFNPSYYKDKNYSHLKTDVKKCSWKPKGSITQCEFILDGGNLIHFEDQAIVTDRVYFDNKDLSKKAVHQLLIKTLELDKLFIIPAVPYELTGHADGMIRFLTNDTLLINDFRGLCSLSYIKRLERSLQHFNLEFLINGFKLNDCSDDATGDYLNHLCLAQTIIVPVYGSPNDEKALLLLSKCYRGFELLPVRCNDLSKKGGVLHCATWQVLEKRDDLTTYGKL